MRTVGSARSRRHVDRLSPLDASNLRVEERGLPMHVAALVLLEGRALLDSSGELRLEDLRRQVAERSRRAARLRQVLVWPRGARRGPVWADQPGFDISRHVHTRRVPEPGDEASLLAVCCELNRPPLDRGRPLWDMWLLTGLTDGRVGLLIRLHHVVADGLAALELLSSMLDLRPVATGTAAPSRPTDRTPQGRAATAGAGRNRLQTRVVTSVGALAGMAGQLAMRARQGWSFLRLGRAPAVSWNRPIGERRSVVLVRADLAAAKAVAHSHHAKVNDVVLAAVGGGARRLLESRGEPTHDLDIHVSVAASIRRPGESGGNRVGIRVVPVPAGEPDPVKRLETVAATTAAQRARPPYQPGGRFLQRWMVRVMYHQRLVNLVLSNVPGPPVPLYFAGARVREMFQLGVVQGNLGLGVGVLSYAGQLNLDIVADADVVPDAAVFANGVSETLARLGATAHHEPAST